jgi:hypothetical protein
MFLDCSTCFERHTTHHQELKNCNCSVWFYIRFWLPAAAMARPSRRPATVPVTITIFELLMMGGVSPETCWAIKKHWNNKFYYTVASCWFLLWDLYYDARIHEHQDINSFTYLIQLKCENVCLIIRNTISLLIKQLNEQNLQLVM